MGKEKDDKKVAVEAPVIAEAAHLPVNPPVVAKPGVTHHFVGEVIYKVDHVLKKVFKYHPLASHVPENERALYPNGKYLDTHGDYEAFIKAYPADTAIPEPTVEGIVKAQPVKQAKPLEKVPVSFDPLM